MRTGLGRKTWLPLVTLALLNCPAICRPLLVPGQVLSVPPLPGAPSHPDIAPHYRNVAIDEGALLVDVSRPSDAEGNYERAIHVFERDAVGRWLHAGILTNQPGRDLAIDGGLAAVNNAVSGGTLSEINVFERGASGWQPSATFQAPYGRLIRIEDGSIYLKPLDMFNPLGCQEPYREFRKVNGSWTQVATIGGQRCDRDDADMNDGRAVITHVPWYLSMPQAPVEVFSASRPAWTPVTTIPPPRGQVLRFGGAGSIRGDTVYIDLGYLYRNVGGATPRAGRLMELEAELNIGSRQGTLSGNQEVQVGLERDYRRAFDDLDNNADWNVLRVYRQLPNGSFVYHARLNPEYNLNTWALSDDGRQVAASGNFGNDLSGAEPRRLYVFEIPEPADFPGTRQDNFSSGSDPWIGLAARVIDDSNYYYMTLHSSQQLSLRRMVYGQVQVLGTVPQPRVLGAWHDLRLEIIGIHIRAYVNGELRIETTDPALSTAAAGAMPC